MKLFNYMALKRKYNTLENKLDTETENKKLYKNQLIEVQQKYISLLEKVQNVDKLYKDLKKTVNEGLIKK